MTTAGLCAFILAGPMSSSRHECYVNGYADKKAYSASQEENRMISRIITCLVLLSVGLCFAQESKPASWPSLVQSGKCDDARSLCNGWLNSTKETAKLVEAHKCLANVALCGKEDVVTLQGNDKGGGILASGYRPEAVDDAIGHLDHALKLAPQDLSIHQGRLHILEVSSRYSDMVKALDESCTIYKGTEGVQAWLDYTSELF